MKNNRSFFSVLKNPQSQLKISIFLSSVISIIFCTFVILNLNILHAGIVDLAKDANLATEAVDGINRSFLTMLIATGFFALASIGAGFLIGVTLTTRVFGPLVPIRRVLGQYIAGDFKARVSLRKHDELVELADDVNTLGALLEARGNSRN